VSDFAVEAEQRRLSGDAHAAIEIAEAGLARTPGDPHGTVALALARIDLGDILQAREELAMLLGQSATPQPAIGTAPDPLDDSFGDLELESAFAAAESVPDEMMDANRLVEQTLRIAELDAPENDFDVVRNPTYATESMAMLLDEQGRGDEADAVRSSISDGPGAGEAALLDDSGWGEAALGPGHVRQLQVVATLEGWLHNLKRHADSHARRARDTADGGAA
jgi:hypothetical protein